jgi:tRNA(Ile)-lysidine synthase
MHPLLQKLAGSMCELARPCRVLAAVSGGADSIALLRGLITLADELKLQIHVGHLNHQLRGEASAADAVWLEETCRTFGVPATIGTTDVALQSNISGDGIEEAARSARYQFLEQTARATNCKVITLAHTANDQAETILHHIVRGTGLAGLRGIPRERELVPGLRLFRPLLDVDREEVLNYLREIGQSFREDESNRDEAYTRNRIRRQLLPNLARDYNPQIAESLRRLGQQAADVQQTLEQLAESLLDRVLEGAKPRECTLKWQPLIELPRHLVREMFSTLWRRQNWPRQQMGFAQWNELAEIACAGGAAALPSRIDARREGRLVIVRVC